MTNFEALNPRSKQIASPPIDYAPISRRRRSLVQHLSCPSIALWCDRYQMFRASDVTEIPRMACSRQIINYPQR